MNTILLLLCLIVYVSHSMGHYMPIVEGNELIRIADQPINETDRVITCKFLLDLLEHNKYSINYLSFFYKKKMNLKIS